MEFGFITGSLIKSCKEILEAFIKYLEPMNERKIKHSNFSNYGSQLKKTPNFWSDIQNVNTITMCNVYTKLENADVQNAHDWFPNILKSRSFWKDYWVSWSQWHLAAR